MELGRFHQVIFICHTLLVPELADAISSVGGGCVVVGDREAAVTTESGKLARLWTRCFRPIQRIECAPCEPRYAGMKSPIEDMVEALQHVWRLMPKTM